MNIRNLKKIKTGTKVLYKCSNCGLEHKVYLEQIKLHDGAIECDKCNSHNYSLEKY